MDLTNEKLEALRSNLKKMVIRECNVLEVTPAQIGNEDLIIGGEGALRLDSLDAVEIVAALERSFGIKFQTAGESRHIFKSFNAMANYVANHSLPERLELFITNENPV